MSSDLHHPDLPFFHFHWLSVWMGYALIIIFFLRKVLIHSKALKEGQTSGSPLGVARIMPAVPWKAFFKSSRTLQVVLFRKKNCCHYYEQSTKVIKTFEKLLISPTKLMVLQTSFFWSSAIGSHDAACMINLFLWFFDEKWPSITVDKLRRLSGRGLWDMGTTRWGL